MRKLNKYFGVVTILTGLLVLSGCRLDEFMFNPFDAPNSYQLDDFEENTEIDIGAEYDLDPALYHQFSVDVDGDKVYCVYVGELDKIKTDTVILYCHGNTGHIDYYWPRIKLLANAGGKNNYGVLAMDYRGYGLSEGKPSEEGLTEDVATCIQWLKEKGLTNERLAIYGFSMGSAPATDLAAAPQVLTPGWLMLEAPFASIEVMMQDASTLAMPRSFLADADYDNAEQIKKVDQPFYWIHGIDDGFLALKTHGEVVYKNYKGPYSIAHRVSGGNHSDTPTAMGYPEYVESVHAFLTH